MPTSSPGGQVSVVASATPQSGRIRIVSGTVRWGGAAKRWCRMPYVLNMVIYGIVKKVTYTLDDDTVDRIEKAAARDRRPRSSVVREAVARYAAESERLGPEETRAQLRIVDAIADTPATRSARAVDAELRTLRESRRSGWRRGTRPRR